MDTSGNESKISNDLYFASMYLEISLTNSLYLSLHIKPLYDFNSKSLPLYTVNIPVKDPLMPSLVKYDLSSFSGVTEYHVHLPLNT